MGLGTDRKVAEMMGDIRCRLCGEPWDSFGVHDGDMEPEEAERFLRGEGCPCCHFGQDKEKTAGDHEEDFLGDLTTETDEDPIELLDKVKPRPEEPKPKWGEGFQDTLTAIIRQGRQTTLEEKTDPPP